MLAAGFPEAAPAERKHALAQLIEVIEVRGRDWIKPTLRLPTVRIVGGEVGRTGYYANRKTVDIVGQSVGV